MTPVDIVGVGLGGLALGVFLMAGARWLVAHAEARRRERAALRQLWQGTNLLLRKGNWMVLDGECPW